MPVFISRQFKFQHSSVGLFIQQIAAKYKKIFLVWKLTSAFAGENDKSCSSSTHMKNFERFFTCMHWPSWNQIKKGFNLHIYYHAKFSNNSCVFMRIVCVLKMLYNCENFNKTPNKAYFDVEPSLKLWIVVEDPFRSEFFY